MKSSSGVKFWLNTCLDFVNDLLGVKSSDHYLDTSTEIYSNIFGRMDQYYIEVTPSEKMSPLQYQYHFEVADCYLNNLHVTVLVDKADVRAFAPTATVVFKTTGISNTDVQIVSIPLVWAEKSLYPVLCGKTLVRLLTNMLESKKIPTK